MRTRRTYGTSVIGECHTCGMQFGDYRKRRQAYNHAKKTGHHVSVEISATFKYN